jgi:DNA-binding HxlR family transcriptional regulator
MRQYLRQDPQQQVAAHNDRVQGARLVVRAPRDRRRAIYALTEFGSELLPAFERLGAFGERLRGNELSAEPQS